MPLDAEQRAYIGPTPFAQYRMMWVTYWREKKATKSAKGQTKKQVRYFSAVQSVPVRLTTGSREDERRGPKSVEVGIGPAAPGVAEVGRARTRLFQKKILSRCSGK